MCTTKTSMYTVTDIKYCSLCTETVADSFGCKHYSN